MTRGILSTAYAPVMPGITEEQLVTCLQTTYEKHPFVRVITDINSLTTNRVKGSNYCDILVKVDSRTNRATIVAVIDNLVKGAAGQAIRKYECTIGFTTNNRPRCRAIVDLSASHLNDFEYLRNCFGAAHQSLLKLRRN
ncbi:N-acetyl-gamma-glutamyl-phosphate reductase [Lysinibacillus sphaericus]